MRPRGTYGPRIGSELIPPDRKGAEYTEDLWEGAPEVQRTATQWSDEMRRINSEAIKLSGEITRAVNAMGYIAHDPFVARSDTIANDFILRGQEVARGKPAPKGALIAFFEHAWSPFVLNWRSFYDHFLHLLDERSAVKGATTEHYEQDLAEHRAAFYRIARRPTTTPLPPHGPSLPTTPRPPSPIRPGQGLPPSPQDSQEPQAPIDTRKLVEYGVIGALALGGVVALSIAVKRS